MIEFSRQAFESRPQHRALAELGGREVGETDHIGDRDTDSRHARILAQVHGSARYAGGGSAISALVKVDFDTGQALRQLHSDCASGVDKGQWELWPDFFTIDGICKLQPRERHERGFPLSTLAFDSQAMLRDRVCGIQEALFHDHRSQRREVGAPVVRKVDAQGRLHCEARCAVFRTKLDGASTEFNVGRYLDVVVNTPLGFKFAQRLCI